MFFNFIIDVDVDHATYTDDFRMQKSDLSSRPFFPDLTNFLSSSPVVGMVWSGEDVVHQGYVEKCFIFSILRTFMPRSNFDSLCKGAK